MVTGAVLVLCLTKTCMKRGGMSPINQLNVTMMNNEQNNQTALKPPCFIHSVNHRFITHVKNEPNQVSILIMEENGLAFGRVYYYNDDPKPIYLDWLSVDESARNNGLGTLMQELREDFGRQRGFKESVLWVDIGSWMHEWYKRRGYEDWFPRKSDPNAIWMRKFL